MNDHRIEIDLRDAWRGLGQRAQAAQQLFQRRDVGWRRASKAAQQSGHASFLDHLRDFAVGQRQDAKDHVVEQFDQRPAGAEGHERAEDRVVG